MNNEEERTNDRKVSCNGGENGHPLIYLEIDNEKITCPYCRKVFIYDNSTEDK